MLRSCTLPFLLLLVPLACCIHVDSARSQTIDITTMPRFQHEDDASTHYHIKVEVGGGFNASVNLRASSPTLPNASFTFSPERLNYPYSDSSRLTVTTTGAHTPGDHIIVVEGYNGPLATLDTVMITVKPRPAWKVYDNSNSPLPSNDILGIAIDANDVAWIGTRQGLMRFDGSTWTAITDTASSPSNRISQIAIDDYGTVYIPGDYSLNRYANGAWTSQYLSLYPNHIAVGHDTTIWCAWSPMVARVVDTSVTFYGSSDANLNMQFEDLEVDHSNAVWILGSKGVVRFDGTFWTKFSPEELGAFSNPRIFRGRADTMYLVDRNGIVTFAGMARSITPRDSKHQKFPGARPRLLDVDSLGTYWVATSIESDDNYSGLGRSQDGQWWTYNVGNSGLPSNKINDMAVDRSNRLWICTDKGLAVLNTALDPLVAFTTDIHEDPGADNAVFSCVVAPNPANMYAELSLSVTTEAHAEVALLNPLGQMSATIWKGALRAGKNSVGIDTSPFVSGAYVVRINVNGFVVTRTLVITR